MVCEVESEGRGDGGKRCGSGQKLWWCVRLRMRGGGGLVGVAVCEWSVSMVLCELEN